MNIIGVARSRSNYSHRLNKQILLTPLDAWDTKINRSMIQSWFLEGWPYPRRDQLRAKRLVEQNFSPSSLHSSVRGGCSIEATPAVPRWIWGRQWEHALALVSDFGETLGRFITGWSLDFKAQSPSLTVERAIRLLWECFFFAYFWSCDRIYGLEVLESLTSLSNIGRPVENCQGSKIVPVWLLCKIQSPNQGLYTCIFPNKIAGCKWWESH